MIPVSGKRNLFAKTNARGGGKMWNFKRCPRCQGDIFIDDDLDKKYEKCLQCGWERELVKVSLPKKEMPVKRTKSKVA